MNASQAAGIQYYLIYLGKNGDSLGGTGWSMNVFSWDVKYVGVQALFVKVMIYELNYTTKFGFQKILHVENHMSIWTLLQDSLSIKHLINGKWRQQQRSWHQGSQFRTVPIGMVGIFHTDTFTGTGTLSFRTGLNTGHTGAVSAIPE